LLPTPQAFDSSIPTGRCLADRAAQGRQINLADLVCCPQNGRCPRRPGQPTTGDGGSAGGGHRPLRRTSSGRLDWGPYRAAVRRWRKIVGRPAPAPATADGRLNPAFVEWAMGLPAGHVTALPLTHRAKLRLLGNGVHPQQAATALRHLLSDDAGTGDAQP
jgi:hypothetical protein